jgi:hypothetical protein
MNTLKNISTEMIRQNWLNYKDVIYNSPCYELLWDSLESKFEIDKNDMYLTIFKQFINAEKIYKKSLFDRIHIKQINNKTLVLKGLYEEERKHIHLLCDKIGLHHESKSHKYILLLYLFTKSAFEMLKGVITRVLYIFFI